MATLSFKQNGECYEAEFKANADYALHIERKVKGKISIQQRSTESGEYADCILPTWVKDAGKVLDVSISHGVYPMNVKIISDTEVALGEYKEAQ